MHRIPLLVPKLPTADQLRPYLDRIDAARWYANYGPLTLELELALQKQLQLGQLGPVYLTSVSNCTVGLELALLAHGLRPGARVLMPGLTFAATATSVARVGCESVLSDVDLNSWLLTPEIARKAIENFPVDAVMPVSTYGCAQDSDGWDLFVQQTRIPVILDAAGAYGNQRPGRRITVLFSLHATKVLSSAEGGLVVSADSTIVARIRRLSNFGIGPPGGFVDEAGTNAKLSEYHAAVALAMLEQWPGQCHARIQLHKAYLSVLSKVCPTVTVQARPADGIYSIMPVMLPSGVMAAEVASDLEKDGIETRRWYCPTIDQHPAFEGVRIAGSFDVVRVASERLLALPFHLFMELRDVNRVCETLRAAIERRSD